MTEGYSADEVGAFASHFNRPVITPRPAAPLPEGVGYAEAINAGKSKHNEDQVSEGFLASPSLLLVNLCWYLAGADYVEQ